MQPRPLDRGMRAHDAVAQAAVADGATALHRQVRPQLAVGQRDSLGDADRLVHPHAHSAIRAAGATVLEQVAVGLQQGVELAAIVPAADFLDPDTGTVVDHVLEGVGQVILARLPGGPSHGVADTVEQQLPVPDVVEPNVGEPGDRVGRLFHDPCHVAVRVRHDDAEPLIIFHLLRPDHARSVRLEPLDQRQVGIEQGVHEHDEHVGIDERLGQRHRSSRAVLDRLLHEMRRELRILLANVLFDALLQVTGDEDGLGHPELLQVIQDVAHDRPATHAQQRLGRGVGMGPESRSLAGERNDDFHGVSLSRRIEMCGPCRVSRHRPARGTRGTREPACGGEDSKW